MRPKSSPFAARASVVPSSSGGGVSGSRVLSLPNGPVVSPRRRPHRGEATGFLPLFWSVVAILACYTAFTLADRPLTFTLAGLAIAFAALLPGWLWCSGRAR